MPSQVVPRSIRLRRLAFSADDGLTRHMLRGGDQIDYRRSMVPTVSIPSGINGHNPTVAYCLVRHIYAIASWRRRRWDRHAMIRFWMKPIW